MAFDLNSMIAEAVDAKAAFNKTSKVGDSVTGQVAAVSVRQVRDIKTNAPQFWDDGTPMLNVVLTLDTGDLTESDTGKRTVYIKWWGVQRKAFAKAIADAGATEPEIGGELTAKWADNIDNPNPNLDPTHVFEYTYTPPKPPSAAPAASDATTATATVATPETPSGTAITNPYAPAAG